MNNLGVLTEFAACFSRIADAKKSSAQPMEALGKHAVGGLTSPLVWAVAENSPHGSESVLRSMRTFAHPLSPSERTYVDKDGWNRSDFVTPDARPSGRSRDD